MRPISRERLARIVHSSNVPLVALYGCNWNDSALDSCSLEPAFDQRGNSSRAQRVLKAPVHYRVSASRSASAHLSFPTVDGLKRAHRVVRCDRRRRVRFFTSL